MPYKAEITELGCELVGPGFRSQPQLDCGRVKQLANDLNTCRSSEPVDRYWKMMRAVRELVLIAKNPYVW